MEQHKQAELRRVQALTGERSLTVVLPRSYALELGLQKGSFLKVTLNGKQLVLEKAEI